MSLAIAAKLALGGKLVLSAIATSVILAHARTLSGAVRNGGPVLRKYFNYRESCYGRNLLDVRRQRASPAASSVLAICAALRKFPLPPAHSGPFMPEDKWRPRHVHFVRNMAVRPSN